MRALAAIWLVVLLSAGSPASAQSLDPLIGARVDLNAMLTDSDGRQVAVRELVEPKGSLMVLGYHRCTNLCGVLQRGLAEALMALPQSPRVLFASLDPDEGPKDAQFMRNELQREVPAADLSNWRFLTGSAAALATLSAPLRMETYVRPGGETLVHPVAAAVLTSEGALSEVFYGLDLEPDALGMALDRAANGYVGGIRDRVVLFCSGIDEAVGRFARRALTGTRIAGAATLLLMVAGLFLLFRRERR